MPLSSVLGASSVIKPGVCTSTTRPSVPYEGQLIYETDTDRLAVWTGSAWSYMTGAAAPPGLVFISSTTIGSAVSSVTVSNAFSSTYDNYFVTISGGVANGPHQIILQLGATTTNYTRNGFFMTFGGTTITGFTDATDWRVGGGNTDSLNGSFMLFGPNLAKRTMMQTTWAQPVNTGTVYYSQGILNDTTQYTAFTISSGGATMTGGTIRVYGYANS